MRTVSHRAPDLAGLRRRLAGLPAALEAAVAPALAASAARVADDVRAVLADATGSAPGDRPSDDAVTVSPGAAPARQTVLVASPRARDLEFGAVAAPARPFLRATALRRAEDAGHALRGALRRVTERFRRERP